MLSSRRRFVSAVGLGGLLLPAMARSATLPVTPLETIGPFYPLARGLDQDADLTFIAGRPTRALGEVVELSGRVLYADGTPVVGAVIDIWQANAAGRYDSPLDTTAPPLDPNFQGSAKLMAGKDGAWKITTIRPGAYAIGGGQVRTRHIHWQVDSPLGRIVTQSYVPGDAMNEADILLGPMLAPGGGADRLMAKDVGRRADGVAQLTWDIVLMKPA